ADGDLSAGRVELCELLEVHGLVLDTERVLEAAKLRGPHDHVELTALEPGLDLVPGLGALGSTTGRLTLRALTASDAGLGLLGTGGGAQVVDLEHLDALSGLCGIRLGSRLLGSSLGRGLLGRRL